MDRDYMLSVIKECVDNLEKEYRHYFAPENQTANGAANLRSRVKKDLGLAKLIEYLLLRCPKDMTVDNADICSAFDRLTERARRRAQQI